MNKKGISTLVIVAIIVIAVVIAGVAVYVFYSGGGEPTPTPTPTPTSVEGATSMRFDVNVTVEGGVEVDSFTVKNLGTSDVLLRVDVTDKDGAAFIYLMNQTGQTAWVNYAGEWMDMSSTFEADYWNNNMIGNVALEKYMTALADWSGTGDYEGDGFIIYNIAVNPTLPDSAFQPS